MVNAVTLNPLSVIDKCTIWAWIPVNMRRSNVYLAENLDTLIVKDYLPMVKIAGENVTVIIGNSVQLWYNSIRV